MVTDDGDEPQDDTHSTGGAGRDVGSATNFAEMFLTAMGKLRGIAAVDQICATCVTVLGVDAAAVSLVHDGGNVGTLGASSAAARRYDEVQFLAGEGPCLDSVALRVPVMVTDLADPAEIRWPFYRAAMLAHPVRAVAAIPVHLVGEGVGALNFFHLSPADLTGERLGAAILAAGLVQLPLLDVLDEDLRTAGTDTAFPWTHLHQVTRAEVAQATGMVMAQLDIGSAEALLRLRAHAYATSTSTTQIARAIIARQLQIDPS